MVFGLMRMSVRPVETHFNDVEQVRDAVVRVYVFIHRNFGIRPCAHWPDPTQGRIPDKLFPRDAATAGLDRIRETHK
jgi:hypothetical protein